MLQVEKGVTLKLVFCVVGFVVIRLVRQAGR